MYYVHSVNPFIGEGGLRFWKNHREGTQKFFLKMVRRKFLKWGNGEFKYLMQKNAIPFCISFYYFEYTYIAVTLHYKYTLNLKALLKLKLVIVFWGLIKNFKKQTKIFRLPSKHCDCVKRWSLRKFL